MTELWRLRQLDPTADWSNFAILARTHATLEPIRAYCELHSIPYRTSDRERGLSATQTREGDLVLSTLRRKSGRMIRSGALRRWLARLAASEPANPWIADLRDCAADLETAVGGAAVPAADAIDWIYESAGAHAREAPGHLNLLTAHGAKGREFDHVLVLDTGDWPSDQPDERRLLYVAMTRAKETLTLFQASQRGNPILGGLEELEAVRRIEPTVVPLPVADLDRIHRELTLKDIDLGFAGRSPSNAVVHRAILELRYGASLQFQNREFKDANGQTVGKLAKKCELPKGSVLSARVVAVVRRTRSQSPEAFQAGLKVEEWETVLAELVIQPDV